MTKTATNQVFISYSRKDQTYARNLAHDLRRRDFDVWIDDRIDYGDRWWQTIVRAIRASAAFIVVMTPDSEESEWVEREVHLALRKEKPIFPLLLRGEAFPLLITKQYVDVTDGRMPPQDFYDRLRRVLRVVDAPESPSLKYFEPEMLLIPAGKFLRGTLKKNVDSIVAEYNTELERIRREVPQRPVFVKEFEIAKYPVTNAEFQRFVEATGYRTQSEKEGYGWVWNGSKCEQVKGADWRHPQGPHSSLEGKMNHPVVQVSWHDAVTYCEWLSRKTGKLYRLPTEAEWEKAARGTDGREWPWGNEWDESKCNTANGGPGTTTPVGQYSPHHGDSPCETADMVGNVWEWCDDWFHAYQGNSFPDEYYGDTSKKVLRGGSWKDNRMGARCAYREGDPPDCRDDRIGFRCARGLPFWQRVLLRLKGLILGRAWLTVLRSSAKRTPAKPWQPVNWEKVGAIAQVIALLIAVIGVPIALGTWLWPNAADFFARPSETPTVTPTSSPTHTPFAPTATLTFTLPPTLSVDFKVITQRMLSMKENGGDPQEGSCGMNHTLYIRVEDIHGVPLDGIVVRVDDPAGGQLELTTGEKGPGKTEFPMYGTYIVRVLRDVNRTYTSEVTRWLNSEQPTIDDLWEGGYCLDRTWLDCAELRDRGKGFLCYGHYSYAIVFQRQW